MMEKRFNDAETSAKEAIGIAEKIQPQDGRLPRLSPTRRRLRVATGLQAG